MLYDDRAFAIYAFALIGAVAALLTATVFGGIAEMPPVDFITEHVGLGLVIRTSYKSFGGANVVRDFLEYAGMITADDAMPANALPA